MKLISNSFSSEYRMQAEKAFLKEIELIVSRAWIDVLKIPSLRLSPTDNFFLLGGNSLLMTQIMARLSDYFAIELTLEQLFKLSSVRKMSIYFEALLNAQQPKSRSLTTATDSTQFQSVIPASATQCGLWFIHQLHAEQQPLYNTSVQMKMSGKLDLIALKQAFKAIILRHEILRSRFQFDVQDNALLIKINKTLELNLSISDCVYTQLSEKITETISCCFDLKRGPLIRVKLFRYGENQYTLVICMHHIITDGWSGGILMAELTQYYRQYHENKFSTIEVPENQYKDFCFWQKYQLTHHAFAQQLEYWKKQLSALPDKLNLPMLRSYKKSDSRKAASQYFVIGENQLGRINRLALETSTTPFMITLAVFNLLLSLGSGQLDILVGTPVANRKKMQWEKLVGCFVNTLVLRNRLDMSDTFHSFLQKLKVTTLQAFSNQDVPFQEVVKAVNPQRNSSGTPIFQHLFVYQNMRAELPELADLKICVEKIANSFVHYELVFEITETGSCLNVGIDYPVEFFAQETIAKMIRDYLNILQQLLENPFLKLNEISL